MRNLPRRLFALTFLACALVAALGGCGYPAHIDPPLLTYPSETLTRLSAEAHAQTIGGKVFHVLDTHSMEPTLKGGDYVVIAPASVRSYESVKAGEIGAYKADWYPLHPVVHRFTTKDSDGWVMSGDNNPRSEPQWRVTKTTFIGVMIGIYRVGKD